MNDVLIDNNKLWANINWIISLDKHFALMAEYLPIEIYK
jgi:hypothetical protein